MSSRITDDSVQSSRLFSFDLHIENRNEGSKIHETLWLWTYLTVIHYKSSAPPGGAEGWDGVTSVDCNRSIASPWSVFAA